MISEHEIFWMMSKAGQSSLLLAGFLMSLLLWKLTWKGSNNLLSISWRMYLTVILTAGVTWFGGNKPDYIIFWTLMFQDSLASLTPTWWFVMIFSIYWLGYMVTFLLIRWIVCRFHEWQAQ